MPERAAVFGDGNAFVDKAESRIEGDERGLAGQDDAFRFCSRESSIIFFITREA